MKNPKKLKFWINNKKKHIFQYFNTFVLDKDNSMKNRIFFDNGAKILIVCHVDTVQKPKLYYSQKGKTYGAGFDDRLGCFLAYNFMLQNKADLLLCDNEERGQSTAEYHICKNYNWIVEFDRAGSDVVTYGLDNEKFLLAIEKHFKTGFGSFSDICFLKTKKCCFNLGIGLHDSHSIYSYFVQSELDLQLKKFKEFYKENYDTDFGDHVEKPKIGFYGKKHYYDFNGKLYTDYDYDDNFNKIPKKTFDPKKNILKDNETFCEFCEKIIDIKKDCFAFNDSLLCGACFKYFSDNPENYDNSYLTLRDHY